MIPLVSEFSKYPSYELDEAHQRPPAPEERRHHEAQAWAAANREHLQAYLRHWKAEHPDRVRLHRQHEYSRRRRERRRLLLRREAQRRRRAINRAEGVKRNQPI